MIQVGNCKDCKNYTPDTIMGSTQKKGYCDKIEVLMSDNYDSVVASTDDLGECAFVGENFGCIKFESK